MPNYRQKNRNKRIKNHNKNQQNQQSNQQNKNNQQDQQQQLQCKKTENRENEEELLLQKQQSQQQLLGIVSNIPATQSSCDDDLITSRISPPTNAPTLNKRNHFATAESLIAGNAAKGCERQIAAEITTAAVPIVSCDTVSRDAATNIERSLSSIRSSSSLKKTINQPVKGENINDLDPKMGTSGSKELLEEPKRTSNQSIKTAVNNVSAEIPVINGTHQQGKVIVHRVIQDENNSSETETERFRTNSQVDVSRLNVISHPLKSKQDFVKAKQGSNQPVLPTTSSIYDKQSKIIIHDTAKDDQQENKFGGKPIIQQGPKVTLHKIVLQEYRVESPQPIPAEKRLGNRIIKKSRSLDDDEEDSTLQIQEISDNSSGGETDNPPLVSEAESETEQLGALSADEDEDSSKVISIQTLPIDEEVGRKSSFLSQQENYKQRRAQKRIAIETHFLPQFLSPRYLDSIKEENSDITDARSETRDIVFRRSASGNFEDEFDDEHELKAKKANAIFPRSNLDFSKKHKHGQLPKAPTLPAIIREETVPMMVEAKIVELVPITENCTTWSSGLTPESEAAEIVYINSASSSVSDLLDLDYDESDAAEMKRAIIDLDTDVMKISANSSKTNFDSSSNSNTAQTNNDYKKDLDDQRVNTSVFHTSTSEEANSDQPINRTIATAKTKLTKITNEHTAKQFKSEQDSSSEQLVEANRRNTSSALANGDDINISNNIRAAESCENSHFSLNQNNFANSFASCTLNVIPNVESLTECESLLNLEMSELREILTKNANKNKSHVDGAPSISDDNAPSTTSHRVAPPPPPVKSDYNFHNIASPYPPPIPLLPQNYAFNQIQNEISEIGTPVTLRIGEPISQHIFSKTSDAEQHIPTTQQQQNQYLTSSSACSPKSIQPTFFFARQESAESQCSDSTTHSQCTAINMGSLPHCNWNDFDAESSISGRNSGAHTTDESFAGDHSNLDSSDGESTICSNKSKENNESSIKKLRLLCTETLASLPYGEDILEELANVAQNIGEVRAEKSVQCSAMPYPLPDLPHITDMRVSMADDQAGSAILSQAPLKKLTDNNSSPPPPPIPEPPTTSKLNSWVGLPTEIDPKLLVCLSPSQQSYLNENTKMTLAVNHPDHLLDAHRKSVEKRGYHELNTEQVNARNREKAAEHKIIKTAAMMKKFRKSLTPPPPIPPPPVPLKSAHTKAKMQKQQPQQHQTIDNSNNFGNNKQSLFAKEDESKHRLLEIIHDNSNEIKQNQYQTQSSTASSHENNSRQTTTFSKLSKKLNNDMEEKQERKEKTIIDSDAIATKAISTLIQNNGQRMSGTENSEHFANSNISDNQTKQNAASLFKKGTTSSLFTIPQQQQADSDTKDKFSEKETNKMQSIDSEFSKLFPSMEHTNILNPNRKRFSNIETSTQSPFCTQILNTQPKRYSTIETSSYETKKKIENGCVVYDTSDSRRESFTDGKEPISSILSFPVKDKSGTQSSCWPQTEEDTLILQQNKENSQTIGNSKSIYEQSDASNVEKIMSPLNLNSASASATADTAATECKWPPSTHHEDDAVFATTAFSHSTKPETEKTEHDKSEKNINRQQEHQNQEQYDDSTDFTLNKSITSSCEEFWQRAKAAEEATKASAIPRVPTIPILIPNDDHHFVHDKLFKEFDDLSKQLNMELESSKANKEKRIKSASLYDLSRMQTEAKTHFEELKSQRHKHMKELEQQIERSQQSRQFKLPLHLEKSGNLITRQSLPRTFDIPIHIERGNSNFQQAPASAPIIKDQRTFEIPVQVEAGYSVTSPKSSAHLKNNNYPTHFHRAESMFDLPHDLSQQSRRQQTVRISKSGQNNADDWTRYKSDLGSSENITRPFAREVEICYKRCKPNHIRAPRMTASTNDLTVNGHSYDSYNAYNARRTHAPMLSQVPKKSKPQYLSCQSMIERDPHPTYISTTSRRGVSPAPLTSSPAPLFPLDSYKRENEPRERRASLPREIQEQQLKYITSKEQELKTEFERLENERHRLLEEMQHEPTLQPPRTIRELYHPSPKLPTLSEDEVFRQQMAEEWLSKVAEREERRLQKIIKISKINYDAGGVVQLEQPCPKVDIGDEFLKRVRERRSKLAMPSDSDWESGAESHPVILGRTSESEEVLPIIVIEGKLEADLRQLPKHLREFAKFSNNESEELDSGHREVREEEERRHEVNENSVSSAVKKSSIVKSYKVSRYLGGISQHLDTDRTEKTSVKPMVASTSKTEGAEKREAFNFNDDSSMAWTSTAEPSSSPFFASTSKFPFPLPRSFSEMFATSPFKSHIYDEFKNYWRNFDTV